ncbi:hypothetical protein CGRA01v4_05171 [Colletotrichum graminicola]|nr:hypothetical protein CGRA01v4_05171 [Colletotrichum graminicola]
MWAPGDGVRFHSCSLDLFRTAFNVHLETARQRAVKSANNHIRQLDREARRSSAVYAAKWIYRVTFKPSLSRSFSATRLGQYQARRRSLAVTPSAYMCCKTESRDKRGIIYPPRYHDDLESSEASHRSRQWGNQVTALSNFHTQLYKTRRPYPCAPTEHVCFGVVTSDMPGLSSAHAASADSALTLENLDAPIVGNTYGYSTRPYTSTQRCRSGPPGPFGSP